MRNVIFRYLFVEVAATWLAVTSVLLFLTLGLAFSRFIGDAAAGELPVNTVLALAAYSAVGNLEVVLPVTVLLAILLTLGRVCRDNELVCMLAGGAGLWRVYRPFLVVGCLVALFAGCISLVFSPRAELAQSRLGAATAASAIQALTPGRFRTFLDGDAVFYAESRDANGDLRHIFIRVARTDRSGQPTETIVTARRARANVNPDNRKVTLILDDGWRYEGLAGQADYRVVKFAEHGVQLAPPLDTAGDDVDTQGTLALLASDDLEAIAEWQTRISVPLSIVILTLLALPIGRVPPRAGRYARVILGIVFYVLYVNAVNLATVGIEDGTLSRALGVWWVHAVVLAIALILLLREQGVFARWRARR